MSPRADGISLGFFVPNTGRCNGGSADGAVAVARCCTANRRFSIGMASFEEEDRPAAADLVVNRKTGSAQSPPAIMKAKAPPTWPNGRVPKVVTVHSTVANSQKPLCGR